MAGIVCNSINNFSAGNAELPDDIVHLRERRYRRGQLTDIIEPEGQDFLLARIGGELIELPKTLSERLWSLAGQKVVVGHVDGQYHAGRCSA